MPGARRHVNNALDIDNRISDGYMVLAMVFQREGDLDLADSNFLRAIRLSDLGILFSGKGNFRLWLWSSAMLIS